MLAELTEATVVALLDQWAYLACCRESMLVVQEVAMSVMGVPPELAVLDACCGMHEVFGPAADAPPLDLSGA